jgi:aromatic-amino-acid transaminase
MPFGRIAKDKNMFDRLPQFTADPILALIGRYAADKRSQKIDLGVGVYKNEAGETPVLKAVKAAEAIILRDEKTKTYLGASGNLDYSKHLKALVLGEQVLAEAGSRVVAFQAVGGTGALRVAADLLAKVEPRGAVWVGTPTWPNHLAIFQAAGLKIESYVYVAPLQQEVDFAQVLDAAKRAQKGDAFLIHACCHNPTGIDFSHTQVDELLAVLRERGVFPLVDCAYAGFAKGFVEDLYLVRKVMAEFDEALICFSCSKNFGLYRERVGLVMVKAPAEALVPNLTLGLSSVARANYSMPPDHGAAIVAGILGSVELKALWLEELEQIRGEIVRKRERLASYRMNTPVFQNIPAQTGMFSLLPLKTEITVKLREEFGIYMTANARINVLGVADAQEQYLVESVAKALAD